MGEEKGVAVEEEGMQCSKHPFKSNPNPGGICAFCLQEKLGKLVSSSNSTSPFFPLHPPPSSNNSSPPSFRSIDAVQASNSNTHKTHKTSSSSGYSSHVKSHRSRSSRISSFLSSSSSHHHHQYQHKKKMQPPKSISSASSAAVAAAPAAVNLKRTKSVAPKPVSDKIVNPASITMDSPRKKSFWSFLYLSSSSTSTTTNASPHTTTTTGTSTGNAAAMRRRSVSSFSSSRAHGPIGSTEEESVAKRDAHLGAVMGEDESPSPGGSQSHASSSSFGRKVARSRSVGCGSRSFSGDFLERLSNGFGDCTLRRVESHRESHSSKSNKMILPGQLEDDDDDDDCVEAHRMRIRCSGFFGSSSSSSYWLATPTDGSARMSTGGVGRSTRGWGWAFASPMRAFRPPPASSASSVKSMPASSHLKAMNGIREISEPRPSTLASAEAAALPPPVTLS